MDDTSMHEDLMASFTELSEAGGQNEQRQEESALGGGEHDFRQEETPAGEQRARDATGRFAPKVPGQDETVQDGKPPAEKPVDGQPPASTQQQAAPATPAQPGVVDKAPASWKPEEREAWKDLSLTAKAAIQRRERETDVALRTSADARKFTEGFQRAIAPFQQMIASEGSDPVTATYNLMQTAALLRSGPRQDKARYVAEMIKRFDVDIGMLDDFLSSGQTQRNDPASQLEQLLDQRLKPVTEFISGVQQRQQHYQTQEQQSAASELDAFQNDPANEFVNDVGDIMADILSAHAQAGRVISLQDAYRRATLAHPEVSQIIAKRQVGQSAAQLSAAARRAQNAAASVSGSGAPRGEDQDEDDGSVRSAIAASVRDLSKSTRM